MCFAAWRAFQGLNDYFFDLSIVHLAGCPWSRFVIQPFQPSLQERERHLPIMPSEVRSFRATALLSSPAAHASTTRARRVSHDWLRARCASDWSRSRSASVNLNACLGRPVRI
jgi:hypothetical protein